VLIQALGLEQARLIALCGAGGKTTLMFALAREFVAAGERALVTTTTKIARDEAEGWPSFAATGTDEVLDHARRLLSQGGRERGGAVIAYSAAGTERHRLVGFAPQLVDGLAQARQFDRILVEADGSARKSLKAPGAHEPVIPAATQALIMVAGLGGLGLPLVDDNVFRAEIWSRLSGLALGAPVSAESLARVAIHAEGLARGCPASARKCLFLNQADTPQRWAEAKRVAEIISAAPDNTVERAVIAHLLPRPEIVEVVALQKSESPRLSRLPGRTPETSVGYRGILST